MHHATIGKFREGANDPRLTDSDMIDEDNSVYRDGQWIGDIGLGGFEPSLDFEKRCYESGYRPPEK